ncbi:hypothetical protein BpHYR1_054555 [Brachionus plicatilis]|uniref:Uncharacterized protein n=1 Tax=Brachionus plicatilis TaxID=10195 RepID=A0A3M7SFG2_BRAPC|nr:hypothetical protein BpHYR1_054555 [Brachionus plicatilis]
MRVGELAAGYEADASVDRRVHKIGQIVGLGLDWADGEQAAGHQHRVGIGQMQPWSTISAYTFKIRLKSSLLVMGTSLYLRLTTSMISSRSLRSRSGFIGNTWLNKCLNER